MRVFGCGASLLILLAAVAGPQAPAPPPQEISFTLSFRQGRTEFRIGEAVDLELRFSAATPGRYQLWTTNTARTVRQPKFDRFAVEPESGVADPLRDIFAQVDGGMIIGVPPRPVPLGSEPVAVGLLLNEWLSIRQPGHYRITAETTRVVMASAPADAVPLRSNTIEIDVVAPEPSWSAEQLQKAIAILERGDPPQPVIGQTFDPRDSQLHDEESARAARVLRFLETREAAQPLARFFEDGPRGAQAQLRAGLFASPYRSDVMRAMETALATPDRAVTYYYGYANGARTAAPHRPDTTLHCQIP